MKESTTTGQCSDVEPVRIAINLYDIRNSDSQRWRPPATQRLATLSSLSVTTASIRSGFIDLGAGDRQAHCTRRIADDRAAWRWSTGERPKSLTRLGQRQVVVLAGRNPVTKVSLLCQIPVSILIPHPTSARRARNGAHCDRSPKPIPAGSPIGKRSAEQDPCPL